MFGYNIIIIIHKYVHLIARHTHLMIQIKKKIMQGLGRYNNSFCELGKVNNIE